LLVRQRGNSCGFGFVTCLVRFPFAAPLPPGERGEKTVVLRGNKLRPEIWDAGSWRRKELLKDDTDTISLGGQRGGFVGQERVVVV
jgi:hypothetical protein